MKRYIILLFLTLHMVILHAQTLNYALPKVENGQWYIALGQHKTKLPINYNYVHHFDNTGHAYFCSGSKFGVIDSTGKVKIPANQREIIQYSNGLFRYAVEKGYLLYSLKTNSKIPCSWSKQIAENWIYFKQEGNHFIFHTSWKEPLPILSEKSIDKTAFNYVYICSYDLRFSLYLPDGKLLEENPEIVREEYDAFYVKGSKNHFLINSNGKFNFPIEATNIVIRPDYFTYCYNEKVHLISNEYNREILVANGEGIAPYKNNFYIYKGKRVGLIDATGKEIIPPKYRSFYALQGNYVVSLNGNQGLINSEGKELIPPIYQSITPKGEYYVTTLFTGTIGLYSAVNYKELLSPYYTKITTDGKSIRAWDNTRLVIITLEEDHREKNRMYLNNVISMNTYKDNTKLRCFDQRLFNLGWYYTSKTITNEAKKTRNTSYLWGIKENDSIRIPAKFKTPTFIENASFSLVPSKKLDEKLEIKLLGTVTIGSDKFGSDAFHVERLKKTNRYIITAMDSTDFYTKEYARILTTKSLGIINKSGVTRELLFVDDTYNGYARYCSNGQIEKNKGKKGNVQIPSFIRNSGFLNTETMNAKINHGTWNYMDKNGDSVFKEPFYEASNFYKKTAIVQGKKGYGVIRKDSLIIPAVFTNIQRIAKAKDTLFLVNRKKDYVYYLDSNLEILDLHDIKIKAQNDSLMVIQRGNKYQLLSNANQILESSSQSYYLMHTHYVIHKENKQYIIRDHKLNQIGTSTLKPILFLDDSHFVIENKGKNALLHVNGDTILGFEMKHIECKNGFISSYGNSNYIQILNKKMEIIVRKKIHKQIHIIYDDCEKYIGIIDRQKAYIYDQKGKQVAKIALKKDEYVFSIYNQLLFTDQRPFLTFDGKCIHSNYLNNSYNWIDTSYYVFEDKLDNWHVLTSQGKFILEEEVKKNMSYLGEDVFSYQDSTMAFVVYDLRTNQKYMHIQNVIGKFSDGYILLLLDGKYEYVDRNFQNIFQKSFDDAEPFKYGLAAVKIDKNWTLISKQGYQKALPTFNKIENKGINLNCIETHNYYGIYDSHGNVIIEPSYLSIHLLDAGIFQARKLGVIDYYTMEGKKIE